MSKRIFTKEQVEKLSQNENVKKCSERSITYLKDFKVSAVKRYGEGATSAEIFAEAGFDSRITGKDTPKECLGRWNKIYRNKGESVLRTETRGKGGGRSKKSNDASGADKIKRLEAEVAYLKAENDFLIKLRAKRAERYSSQSKNI